MADTFQNGVSAQYATRARAVCIYVLRDEHGVVQYVGKANDPAKRMETHYRDSKRRDTPVYRWLRDCMRRGIKPTVETVEVCSASDWPNRERHWVSHFRSIGQILNIADGGDEPKCPDETRRINGSRIAALRSRMAESTKDKLREAVKRHPKKLACFVKWL